VLVLHFESWLSSREATAPPESLAFPDGTPNSFRIVSPRVFILSATFDL
jgi:hypothetical protein